MRKDLTTNHRAEELGSKTALEEDISIHIFDTSATMVGVCLTVIGVFKLIFQLKSISTWADDLISVDAMLFLSSCGLASLTALYDEELITRFGPVSFLQTFVFRSEMTYPVRFAF